MKGRIIINKFKTDVTSVKVGLSSNFSDKSIFKSTDTTGEQLKFNLMDVLMTNKGERFFDPDYGCGLKRLLFEPMDDSNGPDRVEELVLPQIDKYVPQIEIIEINIDNSYEDYNMIVSIKYKIKLTSSTDELNIGF